jgi:hypothetical protein
MMGPGLLGGVVDADPVVVGLVVVAVVVAAIVYVAGRARSVGRGRNGDRTIGGS